MKKVEEEERGISYLKMKGLHLGIRSKLCDGLHLTLGSQEKLRRVLRSAMLVELGRSKGKRC